MEFRRIASEIVKGSARTKLAQLIGSGDSDIQIKGLPSVEEIEKALRDTPEVMGYLADISMGRHALTNNYGQDSEKMKEVLKMIDKELEE